MLARDNAPGQDATREDGAVTPLASALGMQAARGTEPPPSLDALGELVGAELDSVNRHIIERMQSPVALIPQLASHIVAAGGKRLRPMLTLAAARLCGYREGQRHIAL